MADSTGKTTAATTKNTDPSVLYEIWRSLQLVWHLMADSRVPFFPKLIVPLVILYILSPIDVVPDVLLVLGQLDDIALLFFGTKLFINLCPPDIVLEHRRALGGGREFTADDYVDGTYRVIDEDKN
ncbi:MAG: DUF1232 domain-containing protein [Anaerolineae bacterium]|nr:DUF1232 domain-containing protein [Anaerolineae bacterium]